MYVCVCECMIRLHCCQQKGEPLRAQHCSAQKRLSNARPTCEAPQQGDFFCLCMCVSVCARVPVPVTLAIENKAERIP